MSQAHGETTAVKTDRPLEVEAAMIHEMQRAEFFKVNVAMTKTPMGFKASPTSRA